MNSWLYKLLNGQQNPPASAGGFISMPVITFSIILLALPFSLTPELFRLGYFNQTLIGEGQLWRLISGHLSHTSPSHLGWDLLAFALAAGYLERHSKQLLFLSLLGGLITVNGLLLSPWSGVASYAGLSGILFAPLFISLLIFARKQPSLNGWLPMLICMGKVIWEQFSGQALLSQSPWPPYPAAHLAGILAGISVVAFSLTLKTGNRIKTALSPEPSEV